MDTAAMKAVIAQVDRTEQETPSPTDLQPVSGGRAGFADLYDAHYRAVYRYVLSLTRRHEDAEDVTGETFERAYRASLDTQGPTERYLPWLLLAARRLATDRWRRARRFLTYSLNETHRQQTWVGTDEAEFWLWFDQVCAVLPGRQREVLVLRYQDDLRDDDIGRIMGLSESGVRSLVSRALASLRAHPELL